MTFAEAIAVLLAGGKVRRKDWGDGDWLFLAEDNGGLVWNDDALAAIGRDDFEFTDWEEVTQ